jgi:hypothetical protein
MRSDKRATAQDVKAAANVGNLQMEFFEEIGRFPTDTELDCMLNESKVEEKFLDLLDTHLHTATPIPEAVWERAAKLKEKGDAAIERNENRKLPVDKEVNRDCATFNKTFLTPEQSLARRIKRKEK